MSSPEQSRSRRSTVLRLVARTVLNIVLVWLLATYVDFYFFLTGGWGAVVVIGALLTLMNVLIRPVLDVILLPVRLLAHLFGLILVNALFVWILLGITDRMDPSILTLSIRGLGGWIVVALILGIGNWVMKVALK